MGNLLQPPQQRLGAESRKVAKHQLGSRFHSLLGERQQDRAFTRSKSLCSPTPSLTAAPQRQTFGPPLACLSAARQVQASGGTRELGCVMSGLYRDVVDLCGKLISNVSTG